MGLCQAKLLPGGWYQLRRGCPADLPGLVLVHRACYGEPWPLAEADWRRAERAGCVVLVAVDPHLDTVVGYALVLDRCGHVDLAHAGLVRFLGVWPALRRRGIGYSLLAFAAAWLWEQAGRQHVVVWPDRRSVYSAGALEFLRRSGLHLCGARVRAGRRRSIVYGGLCERLARGLLKRSPDERPFLEQVERYWACGKPIELRLLARKDYE